MMIKRSLAAAALALATMVGAAPAMADDGGHKRQRVEHRHNEHGARHHLQQQRHDRHARSHRSLRHVQGHGYPQARHHGHPARGVHHARWDSDRDGVPNRYDRRPYDPYRR